MRIIYIISSVVLVVLSAFCLVILSDRQMCKISNTKYDYYNPYYGINYLPFKMMRYSSLIEGSLEGDVIAFSNFLETQEDFADGRILDHSLNLCHLIEEIGSTTINKWILEENIDINDLEFLLKFINCDAVKILIEDKEVILRLDVGIK